MSILNLTHYGFHDVLTLLDNLRTRRTVETSDVVRIWLQLEIDELVEELGRRNTAILAERAARSGAS